jgi:hypothetical protein
MKDCLEESKQDEVHKRIKHSMKALRPSVKCQNDRKTSKDDAQDFDGRDSTQSAVDSSSSFDSVKSGESPSTKVTCMSPLCR